MNPVRFSQTPFPSRYVPVMTAEQKSSLSQLNTDAKDKLALYETPNLYSSEFRHYMRSAIKDAFDQVNDTIAKQQLVIDKLVNTFQEHDPIL